MNTSDKEFIDHVMNAIIRHDMIQFDVDKIPQTLTEEVCKELLDKIYKTVKGTKSTTDNKMKAMKILKTVITKTKNTTLINLFLSCQMWWFFCRQYKRYLRNDKKPFSENYDERYFDILEYMLETFNFELSVDNNNNETPFSRFWSACKMTEKDRIHYFSTIVLKVAGINPKDPESIEEARKAVIGYKDDPDCNYICQKFMDKFHTKSKTLGSFVSMEQPGRTVCYAFKKEFHKIIEKQFYFGYVSEEVYDLYEDILEKETEIQMGQSKEPSEIQPVPEIIPTPVQTDNIKTNVVQNERRSVEKEVEKEATPVRERSVIESVRKQSKSIHRSKESFSEGQSGVNELPGFNESKISNQQPIENDSLIKEYIDELSVKKPLSELPKEDSIVNPRIHISHEVVNRSGVHMEDLKKNSQISKKDKPPKLKAHDTVILPTDKINNMLDSESKIREIESIRKTNSFKKTGKYKIFKDIPFSVKKPGPIEVSIKEEVSRVSEKEKTVSVVSEKVRHNFRVSEDRVTLQRKMSMPDLKRCKAFAFLGKIRVYSNEVIKVGLECIFVKYSSNKMKKDVKVRCFWDKLKNDITNVTVNIRNYKNVPIATRTVDNITEFTLYDFIRNNAFPVLEIIYTHNGVKDKQTIDILIPFNKFIRMPRSQTGEQLKKYEESGFNHLISEDYSLDRSYFRQTKNIHALFKYFSVIDHDSIAGLVELQNVNELVYVRINVKEETGQFNLECKFNSNKPVLKLKR